MALSVDMLDSVNLGWKLAAAIHGWAPPGLLDTYDEERRVAVGRTMLHAQAQVALRRGHDPAAVALRDLFLELVTDEPPLRRIGALIAGSGIRYPLPNPNDHAVDRHLRTQPDPAHRPAHKRASPGSCTLYDPYSSTSPTARTSARRRETGGIASISTRREPVTGRPTPS